jgi:predicted MFS family arabinose efflux permease
MPRLSPRLAFYLQASIAVFFLAGSSAATPLYPVYQAQWGFSPVTVTVVFGIYALAVLAALLTTGSLSDHIGRRPVLLGATLLQAAAMLVFATAQGVGSLLIARIIQGVSTGAAVAAVGAGLLDLDRARGTIANAVGPLLGTATGGLASGLMVQYLPAPTHLVYLVLLAIFLVQAVGVALMPESITRKPGALASLRPQFRLPDAVRPALLLATPVLVAAWALPGFYGSLGPALTRRLAGSTSLLLGGLAIFVLAASGGLTVLLLQKRAPRALMSLGSLGLLIGVSVTLLAMTVSSIGLFLIGTAMAGVGFGAGFQGAIRTVVPFAQPDERAGVLSILYVVSYLSMGLPAVIAGALVATGSGGVIATGREYAAAVMVLAALALVMLRASNAAPTRALTPALVRAAAVPPARSGAPIRR